MSRYLPEDIQNMVFRYQYNVNNEILDHLFDEYIRPYDDINFANKYATKINNLIQPYMRNVSIEVQDIADAAKYHIIVEMEDEQGKLFTQKTKFRNITSYIPNTLVIEFIEYVLYITPTGKIPKETAKINTYLEEMDSNIRAILFYERSYIAEAVEIKTKQ